MGWLRGEGKDHLYRAVAVALVTGCGAVATRVHAESAIAQLSHEPASMLDLGLHELRESLDRVVNRRFRPAATGSTPRVMVQTRYDARDGQIHILLDVPETPPYLRRSKPAETCGQLLALVRTWMTSDSDWTALFTHAGDAANDKSHDALRQQLPDLVSIEVRIDAPASATGETRVHTCSGTLTRPEHGHTDPPAVVPR